MNILVAKNGSQLGPFSEDDIRARLTSGEFSPADYGWHEGLTAWTPLSQLVSAAPAPPPPQPFYPPQAQMPQPYAPQPYGVPAGQNVPGGYAPQPYNSPYPQAYPPGAMPPWGAQGAWLYAGFWLRVVALIIDAILLSIPSYFVARRLLDTDLGLLEIKTLLNAFNFVVGMLYFVIMESSRAQGTVGKMILGLRVTDEGGNRPGFGTAFGRNLSKLLSVIPLGFGFLMAGFTQRKQALHDLVARALVLRK